MVITIIANITGRDTAKKIFAILNANCFAAAAARSGTSEIDYLNPKNERKNQRMKPKKSLIEPPCC